MSKWLLPVGRSFYAFGLASIGLMHFYFRDFPGVIIPNFPAWLPLRLLCVYVVGAALTASGIAILFDLKGRKVAAWTGVALLVLVLIAHIPNQLSGAYRAVLGAWTNTIKELALAGGAWIAAMSLPKEGGAAWVAGEGAAAWEVLLCFPAYRLWHRPLRLCPVRRHACSGLGRCADVLDVLCCCGADRRRFGNCGEALCVAGLAAGGSDDLSLGADAAYPAGDRRSLYECGERVGECV